MNPDPLLLTYVHDPMCSWCWAFRPVWSHVCNNLPGGITTRRLLGGLAPDSDRPMPDAMRQAISGYWRVIQRKVPGTRFNFEFWERNTPRRSTYPACRAVIAARNQGEEFEESMILGIQEAYYLQARNPSDDSTLVSLAGELGLDEERFAADLNASETRARLLEEIAEGQRLGAMGFPSLILQQGALARTLHYDYNDPRPLLRQLEEALENR